MEMLDASLAFALTLAALSTIVTIILEAVHRVFRVRKWNLILTMKKLSFDLAGDKVLKGKSYWDFVSGVLNNSTRPAQQQLLKGKELTSSKNGLSGLFPWLRGSFLTLSFGQLKIPKEQEPTKGDSKGQEPAGKPTGKTSQPNKIIQSLRLIYQKLKKYVLIFFKYLFLPLKVLYQLLFGNKKVPAGQQDDSWLAAVDSLGRRHAGRGMFDDVTAEHVLRRFAELDEVKETIQENRELVEAQLNKIARKYEEFSSSVAADFKRNSMMWSIFIGIILAFVVNIDAARIYESYLKDQNLSSRVIGQFEQFEKNAREAQERLDDALKETGTEDGKKYDDQIAALSKDISDLNKDKIKQTGDKLEKTKEKLLKAQKDLEKLINKAFKESQAGKAQQAMNEAGAQLRNLSALGVPIGLNYFPHCLFLDADQTKAEKSKSDSKARDASGTQAETGTVANKNNKAKAETKPDTATGRTSVKNRCLPGQDLEQPVIPAIVWIFTTLFTGVLIGFGAPFWFDVARRIAEVRAMFNGQQNKEQRLSGKDINGDVKKRKDLVRNVLKDAESDQQISGVATGPYRDLLNPEPDQGPSTAR